MNPRPQKDRGQKDFVCISEVTLGTFPRGRGSGKTRERGGTGEKRARLGFFAAYRFARNAGRGNRKGADRGRATGSSEGVPETGQRKTQQPQRPRTKRATGGEKNKVRKRHFFSKWGTPERPRQARLDSAETTPRAAPLPMHLLDIWNVIPSRRYDTIVKYGYDSFGFHEEYP